MPKKVVDRLEKVVSTKVSHHMFKALTETARSAYLRKVIPQPTISEVLRSLIDIFMNRTDANNDRFVEFSSDLQKFGKTDKPKRQNLSKNV
jgi:hypothetical protein